MQAWFDTWKGPIGYEIRDLEIAADGDVAFSHSLNHMSGTKTTEDKQQLWFRQTIGFRKFGGEWKMVHAHRVRPFQDGRQLQGCDRPQAKRNKQ